MNDARVERAQRGDPEAFRELVEEHGRAVFRLAFRLTGDQTLAEDVVQEAFLKAHRSLPRFDRRAQFGTWLHRITTNCALDALRSRKRSAAKLTEPLSEMPAHREPSTSDPGPERLARSAEIARVVARTLPTLSDLERAAFSLRHYEGRSSSEIAELLGLRVEGAKHAVFRAVQKLRMALGPLVTEEAVEP